MSNKDHFYMDLAKRTAQQSKDPHTKVGACIVKEGHILSLGWNGAPRKFPDELVPTGRDTSLPLKEQKISYMCHSELNSILNYRGDLSNLDGATIYVTVSPCNNCALALIQVGIKEVVYLEEYHRTEIWEMSKYLLDKCGVTYRKLEE